MSNAVTFNNGLTQEQSNEIDDLRIEIVRLIGRVDGLGRHRSLSLAVTKLDEAGHWLRDRQHRPA